jgi:hypothetical protein
MDALNILKRYRVNYVFISLRILFGIWFGLGALSSVIYRNASWISFSWIFLLISRGSGYSLRPISDVSTKIGSEKNFLPSAYSLFCRSSNFIVSISCLLLRLVTTSYGNWRGSLGRPTLLRAHFAMRYVPSGVYTIFTIYLRNSWRFC